MRAQIGPPAGALLPCQAGRGGVVVVVVVVVVMVVVFGGQAAPAHRPRQQQQVSPQQRATAQPTASRRAANTSPHPSRHLHPPRPRVPGPWPCPSGYTGHLTKHASRSRADAGLQSLERQPCTSAASTPSCWKAAGRLCGLLHAEQIPAPWR
jgi:hypothetical protein